MSDALRRCMLLRTFVSADGKRWSVWRVEPDGLRGRPRALFAWLAFVDEHGTECRRLFEIPHNWYALPPERLDLLRGIAEPACSRGPMWLPVGVKYCSAQTAESAASSRTFVDWHGSTWQVWEVRPSLVERRRMRERGAVARSGVQRLQSDTVPPLLAGQESLRDGWLAFRSHAEHRRRAPIPDGWTEMSDQELSEILEGAMRCERPRRAG
jgi:hypothetical protein